MRSECKKLSLFFSLLIVPEWLAEKNKVAFLASSVARWFIFEPKIPIWVNFGGPYIGQCLYILWPFGVFNGHLEYFMTICYIFPVLVSCTKENLATLLASNLYN
jgi:hypothetical protein